MHFIHLPFLDAKNVYNHPQWSAREELSLFRQAQILQDQYHLNYTNKGA